MCPGFDAVTVRSLFAIHSSVLCFRGDSIVCLACNAITDWFLSAIRSGVLSYTQCATHVWDFQVQNF